MSIHHASHRGGRGKKWPVHDFVSDLAHYIPCGEKENRCYAPGSITPPQMSKPASQKPDPGPLLTILARLIFFLALLGAFGFGVVYALATLVEPDIRETTIQIPPAKFAK